MTDAIDDIILSALSRDARQETFGIWDVLRGAGHNISHEEIESRIGSMESRGIIRGYTIAIDTKKIPGRVVHIEMIKFRSSQALPKRLEGLKKYLNAAPFVAYSGKTLGGYDWITVKSFLSKDMAYEENDVFRNLFGDILHTYEAYDFAPHTSASVHAMAYTESEYKEFLNEWMPPFLRT